MSDDERARPEREGLSGILGRLRRLLNGDRTFRFGEAVAAVPEELLVEIGGRTGLEGAVEQMGQLAERWSRGIRIFQDPGEKADRVTVLSGYVELSAAVSPVIRRLSQSVRFVVDGQSVGEVEVAGRPRVHFQWRPERLGVHHVRSAIYGRRGTLLSAEDDEETPTRVFVLEDRPTVAVDLAWLAEPASDALEALSALVGGGVQLVFFDPREPKAAVDRTEVLAAAGLPTGPVLPYSASPEFPTLGVDFRGVFVRTHLRRARAQGIPISGLSSPDTLLSEAAGAEGLSTFPLRTTSEGELPLEALKRAHAARIEERRRAPSDVSYRLDVQSASRARPGNVCHVELDNRRARERLFSAIEGAEREILLQFYIFAPSRFSEELGVRLIRRARDGVEIYLLLDALYSTQQIFGVVNRIAEVLDDEPGIRVLASDPIETADHLEAQRLKERDHRKLAVFDGELAWVSGRNASDAYFTGFDEVPIADYTPHERIPWLDAHVEVRGGVVEDVRSCFEEAWLNAGGGPLPTRGRGAAPAASKDAAAARLVVHRGIVDTNAMGAYEAILDAARDHVFVVNDFPVHATLRAAVRRAAGRGVRVRFLTGNAIARRSDGTFFRGPLYRELFEYLTKHHLETLMSEGVEIVEVQTPRLPNIVATGGRVRPYVHAKMMTADGEVMSIGSANLDATASYWEREANLVVEGGSEVRRVEEQLRAWIAEGRTIDKTSAEWRREATQRELVGRLWPDALYS